MITEYANREKTGLNPIQAVAKAWSFFKNYTQNTIDLSGKTQLTQDNLSNMPTGYMHTGSIFGSITNIYNTINEAHQVETTQSITTYSDGKLDSGFIYAFGMIPSIKEVENESLINDKLASIHLQKEKYKETTGVSFDKNKDTISVYEIFNNFITNENDASKS